MSLCLNAKSFLTLDFDGEDRSNSKSLSCFIAALASEVNAILLAAESIICTPSLLPVVLPFLTS